MKILQYSLVILYFSAVLEWMHSLLSYFTHVITDNFCCVLPNLEVVDDSLSNISHGQLHHFLITSSRVMADLFFRCSVSAHSVKDISHFHHQVSAPSHVTFHATTFKTKVSHNGEMTSDVNTTQLLRRGQLAFSPTDSCKDGVGEAQRSKSWGLHRY